MNVELLKFDAHRKGWSGTTLAAKARISQMSVSRIYRNGRCLPRTLKKLAGALEEPVDRYLINEVAS